MSSAKKRKGTRKRVGQQKKRLLDSTRKAKRPNDEAVLLDLIDAGEPSLNERAWSDDLQRRFWGTWNKELKRRESDGATEHVRRAIKICQATLAAARRADPASRRLVDRLATVLNREMDNHDRDRVALLEAIEREGHDDEMQTVLLAMYEAKRDQRGLQHAERLDCERAKKWVEENPDVCAQANEWRANERGRRPNVPVANLIAAQVAAIRDYDQGLLEAKVALELKRLKLADPSKAPGKRGGRRKKGEEDMLGQYQLAAELSQFFRIYGDGDGDDKDPDTIARRFYDARDRLKSES